MQMAPASSHDATSEASLVGYLLLIQIGQLIFKICPLFWVYVSLFGSPV